MPYTVIQCRNFTETSQPAVTHGVWWEQWAFAHFPSDTGIAASCQKEAQSRKSGKLALSQILWRIWDSNLHRQQQVLQIAHRFSCDACHVAPGARPLEHHCSHDGHSNCSRSPRYALPPNSPTIPTHSTHCTPLLAAIVAKGRYPRPATCPTATRRFS